jgi:hypothetical protein
MKRHDDGRTTTPKGRLRRLGLLATITATAASAALTGAIHPYAANAETGHAQDTEYEAVIGAYTALTGREPTDAEADFWVRRIDGPPDRLELTWLLATEGVPRIIVADLYTDALGRAPQPDETAYWVGRPPDTARMAWSAAGILSSEEATRSHRDEAYVTMLYRSVLGRDPDPAGLAYWTALMRSDTGRAHEVLLLWGTPEARTRRIRDAYLRVLGRDADPAGLAYWVGTGVDEPVISALLAASDELWRTETPAGEPFVFPGAAYANTVRVEADPATGRPASVTHIVVFAVRPTPETFCGVITEALLDGGATIDVPCSATSPFVTGAWRGGTLLVAPTNLTTFTVTLTSGVR